MSHWSKNLINGVFINQHSSWSDVQLSINNTSVFGITSFFLEEKFEDGKQSVKFSLGILIDEFLRLRGELPTDPFEVKILAGSKEDAKAVPILIHIQSCRPVSFNLRYADKHDSKKPVIFIAEFVALKIELSEASCATLNCIGHDKTGMCYKNNGLKIVNLDPSLYAKEGERIQLFEVKDGFKAIKIFQGDDVIQLGESIFVNTENRKESLPCTCSVRTVAKGDAGVSVCNSENCKNK